MTSTAPIRILLADDHPLVREGLIACLARDEGIRVVGEAASGEAALREAERLRPDVILLDITMPGLNGIQATRKLKELLPKVRILLLTMHNNKEYILEGLRAGADGYALKDAAPRELIEAVRTVHRGERFFSSSVLEILAEAGVSSEEPVGAGGALSARETQVLGQIAEGLSNKEIAAKLGVSVRTIEKHRERIMRKLDIHSTAGLTKYAIAHGLIDMKMP
ncbi:MAG: DNA-binding response regulator [Planctomycetota bacterium]